MHILILIFIFLIIIQVIPLPPKILHLVSPKTYWLYTETIPGYDGYNTEIKKLEEKFFSLDNPEKTKERSWKPISINPYKTKEMLFKLISFFLVFLIVIEHFRDSHKTDKLIAALLVIGTFQAFYGLLEYLSGHQHIFFFKKKYNLESATGTFINPNHFAGFLEMILPVAFGMFFYKLKQSEKKFATFKEKIVSLSEPLKIKNFLIFLAITIIFSGLLLSYSRTGIIVCVLSIIVLFSFTVSWYYKGKAKLALIMLLLLLITLPIIGYGFKKMSESFSVMEIEFSEKGSRKGVWKDSMQVFYDFPLFGSGLGSFDDIFPIYSSKDRGLRYDFVHNDYIQILVETGPAGFLLVLFSIFFVFMSAYKKFRKHKKNDRQPIFIGLLASFLAILIHEFTDFNLYIYSNALLFSVVLSLIIIETKRTRTLESNSFTTKNTHH